MIVFVTKWCQMRSMRHRNGSRIRMEERVSQAKPGGGSVRFSRHPLSQNLRIKISTNVIRPGGSAMRSGTFQNLFRASVSGLALFGGIGAFAAPALAQTTASSGQVETVVVTAERRTTNLQTTPISASVLSADDLKKKSVVT